MSKTSAYLLYIQDNSKLTLIAVTDTLKVETIESLIKSHMNATYPAWKPFLDYSGLWKVRSHNNPKHDTNVYYFTERVYINERRV